MSYGDKAKAVLAFVAHPQSWERITQKFGDPMSSTLMRLERGGSVRRFKGVNMDPLHARSRHEVTYFEATGVPYTPQRGAAKRAKDAELEYQVQELRREVRELKEAVAQLTDIFGAAAPTQVSQILARELAALGVPPRIIRVLQAAGVADINQLRSMDVKALRAIKGLGYQGVAALYTAISPAGGGL